MIDSPSRTAKNLNTAVGTVKTFDPKSGTYKETSPYDYLGLGKGHRRINHDIVTASIMTYYEVGPQAIGPTIVHLLLDDMSEEMKKRVGRGERDVWEAGANLKMEQLFREHRDKYYYRYNRPKNRPPFKPHALTLAHNDKTRGYYR